MTAAASVQSRRPTSEHLAELRKDPKWSRLLKADSERRHLINRKLLQAPMWQVLARWHGTIWKAAIARGFSFWFPLMFWLGPVALFHLSGEPGGLYERALPKVDAHVDTLASVGTIAAFFIIFYANQCYGRWWESYLTSMRCEGCVNDVAALCSGALGKDNPHAAQILRYANLIHVLGYVGLSPEYDDEFFCMIAADLKLASAREMDALLALGPSARGARCYKAVVTWAMDALLALGPSARGARCYKAVVTWAVRVIKRGEKDGSFSFNEASRLYDALLKLRGSVGTLYDYAFQPPFWLSFIVVVLANICFQGLLAVASIFLYPYGTDQEDFAVYQFLTSTARGSLAMLQCQACDFADTDEMRAKRPKHQPSVAELNPLEDFEYESEEGLLLPRQHASLARLSAFFDKKEEEDCTNDLHALAASMPDLPTWMPRVPAPSAGSPIVRFRCYFDDEDDWERGREHVLTGMSFMHADGGVFSSGALQGGCAELALHAGEHMKEVHFIAGEFYYWPFDVAVTTTTGRRVVLTHPAWDDQGHPLHTYDGDPQKHLIGSGSFSRKDDFSHEPYSEHVVEKRPYHPRTLSELARDALPHAFRAEADAVESAHEPELEGYSKAHQAAWEAAELGAKQRVHGSTEYERVHELRAQLKAAEQQLYALEEHAVGEAQASFDRLQD
eukprot:g6299.t1